MVEYEEALARVVDVLPPPPTERVPLAQAHGRILAERIIATTDLPPFDNSSMDGYAVRAADIAGAGAETPVRLRLAGRVAAGEFLPGMLTAGHCVRLFTGSPLPQGANAVVMQEDTQPDAADLNYVRILDAAKPFENVRLQGEDVRCGAALGEAGEVLTAGRLSLLAASGVAEVTVGRQPVVGLIATGSELREPGEALGPGQIYESNRYGLAPLIRRAGGVPRLFPLVKDVLAVTRAELERALAECDVVVTSGGVSVGEMDLLKAAFEQAGGEVNFWRVAMRPGRPFVHGRRAGKYWFGLPGNPVSAMVTFLLLVHPALRRWQGAAETRLPAHWAALAEPLVNPGGRRHFHRVRIDTEGKAHSAGTQASHLLSSLASANGLVDVPPNCTLAAGTTVRVITLDS
jgi:molybdopterin molybdotransferase